jgi:hypothetical protein
MRDAWPPRSRAHETTPHWTPKKGTPSRCNTTAISRLTSAPQRRVRRVERVESPAARERHPPLVSGAANSNPRRLNASARDAPQNTSTQIAPTSDMATSFSRAGPPFMTGPRGRRGFGPSQPAAPPAAVPEHAQSDRLPATSPHLPAPGANPAAVPEHAQPHRPPATSPYLPAPGADPGARARLWHLTWHARCSCHGINSARQK